MPSLSARIPSPIPLPNSGSFFGPNTRRAIKKITSKCMGWNKPSNIKASGSHRGPPLTLPEVGHLVNCRSPARSTYITDGLDFRLHLVLLVGAVRTLRVRVTSVTYRGLPAQSKVLKAAQNLPLRLRSGRETCVLGPLGFCTPRRHRKLRRSAEWSSDRPHTANGVAGGGTFGCTPFP